MRISSISIGAVVAASFAACAQIPQTSATQALQAMATLPVTFTQTIDANRSRVGDVMIAKTMQAIHLENGEVIPSGAKVTGHVAQVAGFKFDRTPYAKQTPSSLAVHFDTLIAKSGSYPLNVYVRAMADPITSSDARKPKPSDDDPDGTLTQVGGELYKPHWGEVINMDEDVVGYSKHGGIVAHLIASTGNSPDGCDGGSREQPVAIFSASACGLYGFAGTTLQSNGRTGEQSTLVLHAQRGAAEIWKNSTALLEVLPSESVTASR